MTMTPDQCFDEMAVALGVPKDTGYTDLLELVKGLVEDKMKFAEKVMEQLAEEIKPRMDEIKMEFAEKVVVEEIKPRMDKLKEENNKLKEENKKLKQEFESYAMTHCCDMSCEECGLTTTEDDLQISLKYGSLICEECYDKKDEEDDEPPDCCEGCGEKFDLQYTMNHADKELREKYDKYFGSEDDCGNLCQICLDSNY